MNVRSGTYVSRGAVPDCVSRELLQFLLPAPVAAPRSNEHERRELNIHVAAVPPSANSGDTLTRTNKNSDDRRDYSEDAEGVLDGLYFEWRARNGGRHRACRINCRLNDMATVRDGIFVTVRCGQRQDATICTSNGHDSNSDLQELEGVH